MLQRQLLLLMALAIALSTVVAYPTPGADWDSVTLGKTVFAKFYAPWCGHCKALAPDWKALTDLYDGSSEVAILSVDCTEESSASLCSENGVSGYPTLKHGDPGALVVYEGGRTLDELTQFAATMGATCSSANLELCSPERKVEYESYHAMTSATLRATIADLEAQQAKAEAKYERKAQKLQKQMQKLEKKKKKKIAVIEAKGLRRMLAVEGQRNATAAAAKKKGRPLTWEEKAEKMEREMQLDEDLDEL